VRLEFEGWPAVRVCGWPSVAIATSPGAVQFMDLAASDNGSFRVVVVETPEGRWPDERFLRLGAKARGWVTLHEVELGYEVWCRLNNFPPKPMPASVAIAKPRCVI
jgi:hypothetical protein